MKVYRDLVSLPIEKNGKAGFRNTVVTIGSYDGVHAGHQQIIKRVNDLARQVDGESVLITFHPHPRMIVYPNDDSVKLITTINEKIEVLGKMDVDNLVIVPFTKAFSQQSPEEYVRDFLVKYFQPKHIVIGYDHRFGNKRVGDIDFLKSRESAYGFTVEEIEKQEVDDIAVSSTKIRKAILEGDIKTANSFLKYPFILTGKVVHGKKIGTEIGYPTANLEVERKNKIIPKSGIYAVYVVYNDRRYKAMLYIGNRPTLNGQDQSIEVNLFDFNADLYGKTLYVEFVAHIRADARFESLEALQHQIGLDKQRTLEILS